TSFMAPLGLRLTVPRVRLTKEEERRIAESQSKLAFHSEKVRVLVPTAGGPPSLAASVLAYAMTKRSDNAIEVLHVDATSTLLHRASRIFKRTTHRPIDEHIDAIKKLAKQGQPLVRRIPSDDISRAIVDEAKKGFDLVALGAMDLASPILADVVEAAPCHVV